METDEAPRPGRETWTIPQLKILTRTTPEEVVLEVCKVSTVGDIGGPGSTKVCKKGAAFCSSIASS